MIIEINIEDRIRDGRVSEKDIIQLVRVLCTKISEEGTIEEVRKIVNDPKLDD